VQVQKVLVGVQRVGVLLKETIKSRQQVFANQGGRMTKTPELR
jgi:hypothetical protein